jgi:parallel beta-helix repeat protein
MDKPVLNSFSPVIIPSIHQYQSYLPNAFDNSLTLLEKVNKVIKALESLGQVSNDVIEQWNNVMLWITTTGLDDSVLKRLDELIADGTLNNLINQTLFSELNESRNDIMKTPYTFGFSSGIQDNTDNLQNALNNSNRFKFPKGDYFINQTLELTNPIIIEGDGKDSCIKVNSNQLADGTRLHFKDIDGIVIRNIRVTDTNQVLGRYNVYGAISFENCKNILLDNVIVENTNGAGIHGIKCENVVIQNCTVQNTFADGIHFQRGSKNVKLINNIVVDNQDDCLAFVSQDYEGYGNCDGFEAYNNKLGSNKVTGSGICCDGSINIKIHDNTIIDTLLSGVRINPFTENGQTQTSYPANVEIYDNTIWGTGTSPNNGNKSGIAVSLTNNVSIKDNRLSSVKGGIFATGCEGEIEVKNNLIREITDRALWITAQTTKNTYNRMTIKDNVCYNIDNDGMYVDGGSDKSLFTEIRGNVFQNINRLYSGGKYGYYVNNTKYVVYENNVVLTETNIINYLNADLVVRKNNLPVDASDIVNIGSAKHTYSGNAPDNGSGSLGDVCWNWNPATGVLCWVNNGSTWQPVNIN